jgi:hypothetical protein
MNDKARSLMVVCVCLCSSISLRAQSRTMDGQLFVTPGASAASSQSSNAATLTAPIPASVMQPVTMTFDKLPDPDQWVKNDCLGVGSGIVSHGILTINSPNDCYEYILYYPKGIWNQYVANWRGWIVEANLQVDPLSQPECDGVNQYGSVHIWAADPKILLIVGFSPSEICISYPDHVHFPMDTTNSFHVYRIAAKGMHVWIYVDGVLAINHVLSIPGGGTRALSFGDGSGYGTSLTKWDYLSYNVFPSAGFP